MASYCRNEDEHRSDARRDFSYYGSYGYDREHYDRYSSDGCKQAYTEEFDKMKEREQERREEERRMEELQERQDQERRYRAQQEEEHWMQMSEQEYEQKSQQEPPTYDPNDSLPF